MKAESYCVQVALTVTFLSGCAALSHELLWTRRLIDLLGAGTESAARVFGCFFLGLAVGAAVAARLIPKIQRPWRVVAMAEAGVAVLALPLLFLPDWSGWIWPALGPARLTSWQGAGIKGFLSVLMVFPPAFLMGGVLPLLARAILTAGRQMHRQGVWLYAVNTLGGVFGLLLTGLITQRLLGVQGAMLAAMTLNLLAGAICLRFDLNEPIRATVVPPANGVASSNDLNGWLGLVMFAFFSGAGVLAIEVIFLQLFQLSAVLSFYATTATLVAIILILTISSFLASYLARRVEAPRLLLGYVLSLAAVFIAVTPLIFMSPIVQDKLTASNTDLAQALFKLVVVALTTLGPGILLCGMVLPFVFTISDVEGGDARGLRFGWLLASNGAGGFIGAELAYRFALPHLGVHLGLGVIAVAYSLAALGAAFLFGKRAGAQVVPAIAVCLAVLITVKHLEPLPQVNLRYGLKVLSVRSGREGQVAVVESPGFGRAILVSNQYLLGSTSTWADQERQAHLPLLLHPNPQAVAFIGLATGSTAAAALKHDCVHEVDAIEISPLVVRAAKDYFASVNASLFSEKRAHVSVEDGRTYLAASTRRFDVVVGDLFLPWAAGAGRLYSQEHFRCVQESLRSGGLFCQWLPMHQLTERQFSNILATFQSVFHGTYLFRANLDAEHPWLGLIGFKDTDLNWQTVESRCAAERREGKVRDPLLRHVAGIQMLCIARALTHVTPHAPLNTLGNCWVEFNAAAERLTGDPLSKYLTGDRWLSFASARHEDSAWRVDDPVPLANVSAVGWMLTYAQALQSRGRAVPRDVLSAIRNVGSLSALSDDAGADWRGYWPGLKPLLVQ